MCIYEYIQNLKIVQLTTLKDDYFLKSNLKKLKNQGSIIA